MSIVYNVYVTTSNIRNAGTDANVYIQLIGEAFGITRQTEKIPLKTSRSNPFETGKTDYFQISCQEIGKLKRIRIGHDNKGFSAGWHLEKVVLETQQRDELKRWICECNRWLARDEDDGKLERELLAVELPTNKVKDQRTKEKPIEFKDDFLDQILNKNSSRSKLENYKYRTEVYKISLTKSDLNVPGIEPSLIVQLFGNQAKTDKIPLRKIKNSRKKFENFELSYEVEIPFLGDEIKMINIGLDNSRPNIGWHINDVIVEAPDSNQTIFRCNNWLDYKQGDGAIERELYPSNSKTNRPKDIDYKLFIKTSNVKSAGTNANVYIQLYGDEFDTGKLLLKSSKTHADMFEQGNEDVFDLRAIDVGEVRKIKIGHDGSGFGAGWHLEDVVIEMPNGRRTLFPCNAWLAKDEGDGKLERDLFPLEELRNKSNRQHLFIGKEHDYQVYVKTSDIMHAGTNAKVYIKIYGELNKSSKILLEKSETHNDKFERGNTDKFVVRDIYYGDIKEIKIGHDGSGIGAGWHLNEVVIESTDEDKKWVFPCNRWLAENEDDGRIELKLEPISSDASIHSAKKKYLVEVFTGDEKHAGTDAEVFLTIYGEKIETSERHLNKSKTHFNKFERNNDDNTKFEFTKMDQFELEESDLGQLIGIRIRHDNSGIKPSWFLERIEITDLAENKKYFFICKKWLSLTRDDKRIERIIKEINYEPDSRIKVTKHIKRKSASKKAENDESNKKSSQKNLDINNHSYLINSPKKYYVKFYTGKKQTLFGTDMMVFIRIFGDYGITKETKLKIETTNQKKSKTHEEKFNRLNIDVFLVESLEEVGTIYAIELKLAQCQSYFEKTNDLNIEKVEICDERFTYEFYYDKNVSIRDFFDLKSHLVEKKLILLEKSAIF